MWSVEIDHVSMGVYETQEEASNRLQDLRERGLDASMRKIKLPEPEES